MRVPHHCVRTAYATAVVLMFAAHTPAVVRATDRLWLSPSGGFFSSTANWSGGVIPGTSDRAIFNQASTYTVAFTNSMSNDRLRISDDTVTFNLGSHAYNLTSTASSSVSVGGAANIHGQPAAHGRLTLTSGTLNSVDTDIGVGALGDGLITAWTGAAWNNSGLLNIGMGTPGTLSIINGADVTTAFGTIGYQSGGTATISGSGSTWTVTNHLDVGGNTTGTLSIQSAGKVTTSSASIGVASGVSGTATIGGVGSRWDQTGNFKIGEVGTGTLHVQGGGLISNTSTAQDTTIGDGIGSQGKVTVDAGTWTVQNRSLSVGYNGSGTLSILNGGHVTTVNNDINIAVGGTSTGDVSVGANSALSARSLYVGGSAMGQGGTATVTIGADAELNVGNGGVLKLWPEGTLHLNSGGSIAAGSLTNAGGTFDWTGGALYLTNEDLNVGPGAPLGASATVGAGKLLGLANGLHAGVGGNGSFNVTGGGTVYSHDAVAGYSSSGAATIDGAGGMWTCYHTFIVGLGGTGTLIISNGGDLESLGLDNAESCGIIGKQPGTNGTATVTGAGSIWHAYGDLAHPTVFVVGDFGTGTLNIGAGGVVAHEASDAILGFNSNSTGTVNVTGAGSRWTTDTYNLTIGQSGTGNLNVTTGGLAENPGGLCTLGTNAGASGTATIDGIDSRLTGFQMNVGYGGLGHITIRNGGALVENEIYVSAGAGSTGDITVDGTGSSIEATTGFGYLIPGSASTGSLTVQNGATAHALETIIGDGANATGDLVVTGPNSQLRADDEIDVGFFGHGTLEVHDGGAVSTRFGSIGHADNSDGTLIVTGADSRLSVEDELDVGFFGHGTLEIHDGGSASMRFGTIGYANASTGVAIVDGAGSNITLSDRLEVGGAVSGRLMVGAGGTVNATNAIRINSSGTIDLTGGAIGAAIVEIAGGALIGEGTARAVLSNTGRVAPGHSAGTLHIVGAYVQAATGTLEIELGGSAPGTDYDQLAVAGAAALNGTLRVSLIGGFQPDLGQTFEIVPAGSVTGAFATVLPDSPSLGVTVHYNPQSVILQITHSAPFVPDLNHDGDVDLGDYNLFRACMLGPGVPQMNADCANVKLDADNDVDLHDLSDFQRCFRGADTPAHPNCTN